MTRFDVDFICPLCPHEKIENFTDLLYHTWSVHEKRNIRGNIN